MGDQGPRDLSIIEGAESMRDFKEFELEEVREAVRERRQKIFLLMEEVRRLRIQEQVAEEDAGGVPENDRQVDIATSFMAERFPSALPAFPSITSESLRDYYIFYAVAVCLIIFFGGYIAPTLEVRLGIGGQSYAEFIDYMHLPKQLAQVDPITASFVGGVVGSLSAALVVEVNNVKERVKQRCLYCSGSGYLSCAKCGGTGGLRAGKCEVCVGSGKVMCTSCLCTGKTMASEYDPRIDPFNL